MDIQIVKIEVLNKFGIQGVQLIRVTEANGNSGEWPLLHHVQEQLGTDKVAYFNAAWSSIVGWGISSRVEDQGW